MSAYLCDESTINALATYAAAHKLTPDPKLFAELLTLQNVRSMMARYPGRPWLESDVLAPARAYRFEPVEESAARIAELAAEYDYQACETEDYDATLCKQLVDRVLILATANAELERKRSARAR